MAARPLRGRLRLPGCKGISHRALLFAALADGTSTDPRASPTGDDVRRTASALVGLGVRVRTGEAGDGRRPGRGCASLREPAAVIDCAQLGHHDADARRSARRAAVPFGAHRRRVAASSGRWRRVVEPLRRDGCDDRRSRRWSPRAARRAGRNAARGSGRARGRERPGEDRARARRAPGRRHDRDRRAGAEPRPHRADAGRALGARSSGRRPHAAGARGRADARSSSTCPGDPSSAAFFVVAATDRRRVPTSCSRTCRLNPGRIDYLDVLRAMGARIEVSPHGDRLGEPVGDIRVRAAALHGTDPREPRGDRRRAPGARGRRRVRRGRHRRSATRPSCAVKESDRIATLEQELTRLGIRIDARPDGLVVHGGTPAGRRRSRATATTGSRWRPPSPATPCRGESTVRGWPGGRDLVPGVRRRSRSPRREATP